MLMDVDTSQLVLVDYQARLMPAMFESELVLGNAVRLAKLAALMEVPAFYTEQNPGGLGHTVPDLAAALAEARAKVLNKMQFSAIEEGLGEWLRPPAKPVQGNARSLPKHLQKPPASERGAIVIAGCEAHVCLMQTALDLLEDEFEVWVVTDACSSRTERNRDAAFDRLAGAGAELVTTEMVVFEWIRTAEHPVFKEAQALIK
ncbi:putative hydrolase YcaC [Comamonadaceae bacterium OS-4]|jgi:nicotinamidase-related amidase|uniref:Isochorismatase family protein n=1 Tax=Rhodoferax potami TaxID=3068338 RepID=A0ABU3KRH1_9BURK|nr:isochorismatase family protein [Rhodoferax sp. TBRC 17660]MDT7520406.1 isochorismatase family protein [Rhodoferax sp. TBRC 17660]BDT72466.1 putative hydrolase YcaC [Comamonadaceae bacterium OS-4]